MLPSLAVDSRRRKYIATNAVYSRAPVTAPFARPVSRIGTVTLPDAGPLERPRAVVGAAIQSFAGLGPVNVEHGLAADAAVQQGVDRRLRLAPRALEFNLAI